MHCGGQSIDKMAKHPKQFAVVLVMSQVLGTQYAFIQVAKTRIALLSEDACRGKMQKQPGSAGAVKLRTWFVSCCGNPNTHTPGGL